MTVSWGGLGTLWNKPVATVYVKPVRHTHGFMEQSEYFTLGFYDASYHEVLERVYGGLSGRDADKAALSALRRCSGRALSPTGRHGSRWCAKKSIGRTCRQTACPTI